MNWKVYYLVFVALLVSSYSNSQSNLLNATEVDQIGKQTQEKIAAEASLASGGPASGRVKSVKSRVEAAVGETKESRILEAGGGKKAGDQNSKIVEAGGGKKITPVKAQEQFEEEKSILEEE